MLGPDLDFKKARAVFEARYLEAKLHECGGNITRLAETIGLERSYLHRKLKGYGISSESRPRCTSFGSEQKRLHRSLQTKKP